MTLRRHTRRQRRGRRRIEPSRYAMISSMMSRRSRHSRRLLGRFAINLGHAEGW
jgi:hypothetical protein